MAPATDPTPLVGEPSGGMEGGLSRIPTATDASAEKKPSLREVGEGDSGGGESSRAVDSTTTVADKAHKVNSPRIYALL